MWCDDKKKRNWRVPLMGVAWGLLILVGGLSCENKPTSSSGDPSLLYDLRITSGNNQRGNVRSRLGKPFQVRAENRQGAPLKGVAVRFAVTAGSGVLSDTTVVTKTDGLALTHLTLGGQPGLVQVTTTAVGLPGLPPVFSAIAEQASPGQEPELLPEQRPDEAHFSLIPEKVNMAGGVRFGLTNRLTAFVFDASSNFVPAGTLVRFRTTGGGIQETARTDELGRATATLTTAEPIPPDGWVTVTAETAGKDSALLQAQARILFSGSTVIRLIQPAR